MKRKDIELKRREWLVKGDPRRVVYATLTWYPTDRINGYPARYTAILANVRRDPAASGLVWEVGNPLEAVCRTMLEFPKGARRSRATDDDALGKFGAFILDHLPRYLERYGLSIDADNPDLCAP